MDTSGLMVAAKSDEVQKALQDLIRLRVLDRRYVVLVHGYVAHDKGTIVTGIARSTRDRLRMTVTDDPAARESITTYTTLERFEAGRRDEGYSLLECHLYTGARTRFASTCATRAIRWWETSSTAGETTAPTMDCAASSSTPGTSRLTIR